MTCLVTVMRNSEGQCCVLQVPKEWTSLRMLMTDFRLPKSECIAVQTSGTYIGDPHKHVGTRTVLTTPM